MGYKENISEAIPTHHTVEECEFMSSRFHMISEKEG